METFEALILGLLQGLTEFLPVSSSGHLVLAQRMMGINTGDTTFEILVHAATVLATITIFWREIIALLTGGFKALRSVGRNPEGRMSIDLNPEARYLWMIVISMIPVLIVGLFFKDHVEALFSGTVRFVGCMLLITAALLLLSHLLRPRKQHPVRAKDALIIGLAQACAVVPGISRSGSTIATGLMLGNDRTQLAKFSFLMVLVPILGEAFLELLKGEFSPAASGIPALSLITGFLAAYLAGLFACKVMIRVVSRGKLYWFALYCAVIGVAAIIIN